jgi:CO/xanthine dehydrogenase Mo-binding subunit
MMEAEYRRPYQMHASIGPSCAVALYRDEALTVWTHGQGVYPLRGAIAEMTGLPAERVRCIHMEGAGCYGHNGADDAAADAALLARALPGRAVRVQWMREDEHGWEPYGPAMLSKAARTRVRGRRGRGLPVRALEQHAFDAARAGRLSRRRVAGREAVRAAAAAADPAARPAAATATPSRSTSSRTRAWCTTS